MRKQEREREKKTLVHGRFVYFFPASLWQRVLLLLTRLVVHLQYTPCCQIILFFVLTPVCKFHTLKFDCLKEICCLKLYCLHMNVGAKHTDTEFIGNYHFYTYASLSTAWFVSYFFHFYAVNALAGSKQSQWGIFTTFNDTLNLRWGYHLVV